MNFSTPYLGMELKSPLIPSSCQRLSETIEQIKRMEDSGAGAVVLYSLFEEQIAREAIDYKRYLEANKDSFSEAASFFPEPQEFLLGPEEYLEHIAKAKRAVDIPVIASLNGSSMGGWTSFAKQIEQAGADAIELNLYRIPTELNLEGTKIEDEYIEITKAVKASVSLPIAVKLSPYFTNLAHVAKRFADTGVRGLTLFNRFYQPDIDIENLEIKPEVVLSSSVSLRLPLRWIAILYGRIPVDFAGTSGVQRSEDCLKLLMAGASAVMVCAALLRHGIEYLKILESGIKRWMEEHEYHYLSTLQGSMSQLRCPSPSDFERAQYIYSLHHFQRGRKI